MTKDELDLVETPDLFDALSRRFKMVVVLAEKEYGESSEMEAYYAGGYTQARGLLARAPRFLERGKNKRSRGSHPE